MRRHSAEERYVLARIREALESGLHLDENLAFLCQEWRFPSAGKIDLLALDIRNGQIVIIEAKSAEAIRKSYRESAAREQAAEYVERYWAHAKEYMPFFQRLASAMERIYGQSGGGLRVDASLVPRWEVWWPGGRVGES